MNAREKLRAAIRKKRITVAMAAEELGVSRQYLYLLMAKKSGKLPSIQLADRLHMWAGIKPQLWDSLTRRQLLRSYVPRNDAA